MCHLFTAFDYLYQFFFFNFIGDIVGNSRPSSPKSCDDLFKDDESSFSLSGAVNAALEAEEAADKSFQQKTSIVKSAPNSPPSKKFCSEERNAFSISNVKSEPKTEVSSTSDEFSNAKTTSSCSSSTASDSKKSLALSRAKRSFSEALDSIDEENDIKTDEKEARSFSRESTLSPPASPKCSRANPSKERIRKEENAGKFHFVV